MELVYGACLMGAFWVSGIIYGGMQKRREHFLRRLLLCTLLFAVFCAVTLFRLSGTGGDVFVFGRLAGFCILILFQHTCWEITWSVAAYGAVWAVTSWQLIYALWQGMNGSHPIPNQNLSYQQIFGVLFLFAVGDLIAVFTVARPRKEDEPKKIGPRQLTSAILIYGIVVMLGIAGDNLKLGFRSMEWQVLYLSQVLLALLIYLQKELFYNSAMRQELAVMNLLWKKEQEQYRLSKENIALINHKCHDLKHQIRAIRGASKEDMDKYLAEMEDSIRIYESIVKTGNEVLDTILTEKSLYCRERGITVSCVADGSQMEFINTVDLYAILGNALDNAIEAVEKFRQQEMRQIDVLIHRQQSFLVIQILNPIPSDSSFVYEEELPVTTKGDRQYHGFGLRSMRYLVKKYDGCLTVGTEDGCFSLKILIPIRST